jgi:hypothetical protein
MEETKFDIARLKYKPSTIKVLLLAEAPPEAASKRFFYFEDVSRGDTLFLETMKALYPEYCLEHGIPNTKKIRSNKRHLLTRFRNDGYYLEDSCSYPLPKGISPSQKVSILKMELPNLLTRLSVLITTATPIILISSPVFKANYKPLTSVGYSVINVAPIPFPLGFQNEYKAGILHAIKGQ